jgi:uncharacterized protein (DUF1778 family)
MTAAAMAYLRMPANERQEFRLPKLLKDHLNEVATLQGESVAQYVIEAVAERVTRDLAQAATWELTIPEQRNLLEVLARPALPTSAFVEAMRRADVLIGPLPTRP